MARFENLDKENEEEDKKRAQEEKAKRQAKEEQEVLRIAAVCLCVYEFFTAGSHRFYLQHKGGIYTEFLIQHSE